MIQLRDLKDGMQRVDARGTVVEVSQTRTVNLRTGGSAETAEATLKDDSGTVALSLWDDQIEKAARGIVLEVHGGYTNTYKGQLKLNVGKFGTLAIVGKTEPLVASLPPKPIVQMPITPTEEWIRDIVRAELKRLGLIV